jgi:hypothetical protein
MWKANSLHLASGFRSLLVYSAACMTWPYKNKQVEDWLLSPNFLHVHGSLSLWMTPPSTKLSTPNTHVSSFVCNARQFHYFIPIALLIFICLNLALMIHINTSIPFFVHSRKLIAIIPSNNFLFLHSFIIFYFESQLSLFSFSPFDPYKYFTYSSIFSALKYISAVWRF